MIYGEEHLYVRFSKIVDSIKRGINLLINVYLNKNVFSEK